MSSLSLYFLLMCFDIILSLIDVVALIIDLDILAIAVSFDIANMLLSLVLIVL